MAEYIKREDVICAIKSLPDCPNGYSDAYDKAVIIGVIEDLPTADVVSSSLFDQIDWERTVAISQLAEIGKSLGEQMDDVVKRKKGKWRTTNAFPHWLYCDQCHKRLVPNVNWIEEYNIPTNFCSNCGSDMRGEKDV